jgi:hypothetical protein
LEQPWREEITTVPTLLKIVAGYLVESRRETNEVMQFTNFTVGG